MLPRAQSTTLQAIHFRRSWILGWSACRSGVYRNMYPLELARRAASSAEMLVTRPSFACIHSSVSGDHRTAV